MSWLTHTLRSTMVNCGFPSQWASKAENVSLWWRYHVCLPLRQDTYTHDEAWWIKLQLQDILVLTRWSYYSPALCHRYDNTHSFFTIAWITKEFPTIVKMLTMNRLVYAYTRTIRSSKSLVEDASNRGVVEPFSIAQTFSLQCGADRFWIQNFWEASIHIYSDYSSPGHHLTYLIKVTLCDAMQTTAWQQNLFSSFRHMLT